MQSRTLVFVLLGVFILLTIAVFVVPREGVEEVSQVFQENNAPDICKEQCNDNGLCIEQCKTALLNQVSLSMDRSKCDEFKGSEKELCWQRLRFDNALEEDNLELCNGLQGEGKCKDMILYNRFLKTKDKSICGQLIDAAAKEACLAG